MSNDAMKDSGEMETSGKSIFGGHCGDTPLLQSEAAGSEIANTPSERDSDGVMEVTPSSQKDTNLDDPIASDAYLLKWDMTLRSSEHCERPFASNERLKRHRHDWTDGSCRKLPKTSEATNECLETSLNEQSEAEPVELSVPGGDLIIPLQPEQTSTSPANLEFRRHRVLVASQMLWTASPTFRSSLGPDSVYASAAAVRRAAIKGQPPAMIELDDLYKPMKLVLQALCHRYDVLPSALPFEEIVEVAVIADKYELEVAILPFVTRVLQPYKGISMIEDVKY